MIVVDTSVWIDYFNGIDSRQTALLDNLLNIASGLVGLILFLVMTNRPDKLDVDLPAVARAKIVQNALKYPVATSRGSSRKYDAL